MTKDTDESIPARTDAKIAMKFAQLRAAEADCAPAVTRQSIARESMPRATKKALPRVAAGLVLLTLAYTWFSAQPEEDPASVYTSIMSKHYLQTDTLLEVSAGVLPAMSGLPGLYEPDIEADPETYTN